MENNNKDYLNGDHSFKKWFSIMWENKYIQIFIVSFTLLIVQLFNLDWCAESWLQAKDDGIMATIIVSMGLLLPLSVTITIVYKGFYQFWDDLKKGSSR